MNKKLKTFEGFSNLVEKDPRDVNYEEKIEEVLVNLMKKKENISLLKDTIEYICRDIEKTIPDIEQFLTALEHYDDNVYKSFIDIKENMLDGMPNIKDIIEDIFEDFKTINDFLIRSRVVEK